MIWQMMMALLHSNGPQKTEKDGDTQKGYQNLLYSRRLLMTAYVFRKINNLDSLR